jgi:polyribonucleotide nucleotidyltransferase
MNHITKTVTLPNGKEIHIETGRLAKQADGSVVVRCGDTMLLATVVSSKEPRDVDFLPLSVDYVEKYSAAGKIPGGFFKREGRLGEREILTSRLVDRALRPLFPKDYHSETQVIIQLISSDREEQSDALACFAASAALMVSDIPFADPVTEVRVGMKDGEFIINPTVTEMDELDMDIMVAATNDSIVMVEGEMKEVSEEDLLNGMIAAHESCRLLNKVQQELREELGIEMREYETFELDAELVSKVRGIVAEDVTALVDATTAKQERSDRYSEIKTELLEGLLEGVEDEEEKEKIEKQAPMILKDYHKELVRAKTIAGTRLDGRKLDDVRDIWCDTSYLPRAHGSSIFTRGETQSLCTVTLGTKLDEQTIDGATVEGKKRFMLHYNFPPFSTGEARFLRGPGRREIGHGNLAERALKIMMPEDYEYTVRVIADILESNGSSSMASVCGGSLALMDAGVPVVEPVSGIAMGLITDAETGKYAVLSDILGDEDFIGDMDFKVAGTKNGLTACQMDIKVRGLSYDILRNALEQSKAGRLHILDKMLEELAAPRPDLSPYAPRIESMEIPTDMIGAVIGPGGKIVQEIQRSTETTINLEEIGGKGIVTIYSTDLEKLEAARQMIKNIIAEPEIGATYDSTVKSIKDFGAFVEFMPGREGLLHISEISYERLPSMDGVLEVGQEIQIKLIGIDEKSGKFRLSHKALLPKPEGWEERPRARGGDRRGGGRDRRGGDRRGGDRRGGDRRGGGRDRRGGGGDHNNNED